MIRDDDDRAVRARLFAELLGESGVATPDELAARAGVSREAASDTLVALERDGLLAPHPGGGYTARKVETHEVEELYPAVLVLEAVAVRDAPAFTPDDIEAMRAANERLETAPDGRAGARADDDFHRALTGPCGNEQLLGVVRPIREALMGYEAVYFGDAQRRARSAAQHAAIIAALEAGDRAGAATLVRDNFTTALPELTAELDARAER